MKNPNPKQCACKRAIRAVAASTVVWIAGVAMAGEALASPWTRPQGDVFVETRVDAFRADAPGGSRFERLDFGAYAEWGVAADTMVGGKLICGMSRSAGAGFLFEAAGIVEIEGFVQRTISDGPSGTIALRGAVARPAGIDAGARPELAADGVDLEIRALYGRTLRDGPGLRIFSAAEAAFRKRTGAAADQIRIDWLLGLEPTERLIVLAETQTTLSLRNEDLSGADFDVVRLQPSVVWRASDRLALRAGGLIEVAARGLTKGRGVFIGVWSEF